MQELRGCPHEPFLKNQLEKSLQKTYMTRKIHTCGLLASGYWRMGAPDTAHARKQGGECISKKFVTVSKIIQVVRALLLLLRDKVRNEHGLLQCSQLLCLREPGFLVW